MSRRIMRASLPVSLACLALGYTFAGFPWIGFGLCLIALVTAARPSSLMHLPPILPLPLIILLAVGGIFFGAPDYLMLGAVVGGLSWWDLDAFQRRLLNFQVSPHYPQVEYTHLKRLGSVLAVGLILGLMASLLRLSLSLGWAVSLGLVLVFGFQWLYKLSWH